MLLRAALLGLLLVLSLRADGSWSYPEAPAGGDIDYYQDVGIADPYRWLEATESSQARAWLVGQNMLTTGFLSGLSQRAALRDRLVALWSQARWSLPQKAGGRYFFLHSKGMEKPPALYVQDSLDAEPRQLLDAARLISEAGSVPTSAIPSPDGRRLLLSRAAGGSDWSEYRILNLDTMMEEPDVVGGVKFSNVAWTRDSAGFFYSRYPQAPAIAGRESLFANLEKHRLYYHRLGTPQRRDLLIHEWRGEERCFVRGRTSQDGRFLVVTLTRGSSPESQILCADLGDPLAPTVDAKLVPLVTRWDDQFEFVGNVGEMLFFRSTWGAPRGCVLSVSFSGGRFGTWRTVVPEGADTLESASLIGGRLVVKLLHQAASRVRFYTPDGFPAGALELPGNCTVTGLAGRWEDREMLLSYTDFTTPPCNLRHDFETALTTPLNGSRAELDQSPYITEQVTYSSRDGTSIPMFVTRRRDVPLDGKAPAWLYGYGGFNVSLKPVFSAPVMVWLEQGGVYAVPNLRGGGEFGQAWHEAGIRENRQKVIDDFLAAAEYLIERRYTRASHLLVTGESNGGMLVAAAINQRPELFRVASPASGVMDMLRYHKFTIGYAWSNEYGSSDDPAAFRYLRAYSPLHNVRAGLPYPAVLVVAGDNDDRVHPSHSYKYVATLQAAVSNQPGDLPVMLRVATRTGHGQSRSSASLIEEDADRLAFALHYIGLAH